MNTRSDYQPQFRTKTGAVLLAFFITGDIGAHWFYLGEPERGFFYLKTWGAVWALFIGALLVQVQMQWLAVIMGTASIFGAGVLFICRMWDFFHLLSMHPTEFDYKYNA